MGLALEGEDVGADAVEEEAVVGDDHGAAGEVGEGDAHVEWFEGNFEDYEADKIRRLGPDAVEPKRIKYKKFAR